MIWEFDTIVVTVEKSLLRMSYEYKSTRQKIDIKFRAAIYAMGEFAMARLVPSTRLRNNITLNIHLKHHVVDGEAKLSEFTNPKKPREFKIIIDPHRAEVDDFNRTLTDTEWSHAILRLLAHELVHVKQYVMGRTQT